MQHRGRALVHMGKVPDPDGTKSLWGGLSSCHEEESGQAHSTGIYAYATNKQGKALELGWSWSEQQSAKDGCPLSL